MKNAIKEWTHHLRYCGFCQLATGFAGVAWIALFVVYAAAIHFGPKASRITGELPVSNGGVGVASGVPGMVALRHPPSADLQPIPVIPQDRTEAVPVRVSSLRPGDSCEVSILGYVVAVDRSIWLWNDAKCGGIPILDTNISVLRDAHGLTATVWKTGSVKPYETSEFKRMGLIRIERIILAPLP